MKPILGILVSFVCLGFPFVAPLRWLFLPLLACTLAWGQVQPCTPTGPAPTEGKELNVDYILAIDSSGSMHDQDGRDRQNRRCSRWQELQEKLIETVQSLEPGLRLRLHLLFFGTDVFDQRTPPIWEPLDPTRDRKALKACTVDLKTVDQKAMVLKLLTEYRPVGGSTALYDAVGACYNHALELYHAEPERRIFITVFSDGADTHSTEFRVAGGPSRTRSNPLDLCAYVQRVQQELGPALVDAEYRFVQVAATRVPPPCGAITSSRTPALATVQLGPGQIDAGSLADQSKTDPSLVTFTVLGTLPPQSAFPLFFEPGPGAPPVRVTCQSLAPAAVGAPGTYQIIFHRAGPAELYAQPFEGKLGLDLGPYRHGAVDRLMILNLRPWILVRFAGRKNLVIDPRSVQPGDGLRVLTGTSVTFRAPLLQDATYEWVFSGPGTESAPVKKPEVTLRFPVEGPIDARLTISQPPNHPFTVTRKVQVIDPKLTLTPTPSNPVESESVQVRLGHNPTLKVSRVTWEGSVIQARDLQAQYAFNREGTYPLSATVETELGRASTSTPIAVGPGVPVPTILAPVDVLFVARDPQPFSANAGRAVGAVRFSLVQNNRPQELGVVPVSLTDGRWVAQTNWTLPPTLRPGPALVIAESLARDPQVGQRLGPRRATNTVELTPLALLVRARAPTDRAIPWGSQVLFEAELLGPGAARIEAAQWDVLPSGAVNARPFPGLGALAREFRDEADRRVVTFGLQLDPTKPEHRTQLGQTPFKVRLTPQGDERVIEGRTLEWDGLRTEWPACQFALLAPRRCLMDQPQRFEVREFLGDQPVRRVHWTVRNLRNQAQAEYDTEGPALPLVLTNVGPHELRAEVQWDGGTVTCPSTALYVEFEPVDAQVDWDGGHDPELTSRGAKDRNSQLKIASLRGTRARAYVDVQHLIGGTKERQSVPGWPKPIDPSHASEPVSIPWPAAPNSGCNDYLVSVYLEGYTPEGAFTRHLHTTFRILNYPAPRLWLLFVCSIGLLGLLGLAFHACYRNRGADHRLWVASDPARFLAALTRLGNERGGGDLVDPDRVRALMKQNFVPAVDEPPPEPASVVPAVWEAAKTKPGRPWSLLRKRALAPLPNFLDSQLVNPKPWPAWSLKPDIAARVSLRVTDLARWPWDSARLVFGVSDRETRADQTVIDPATGLVSTAFEGARPAQGIPSATRDFLIIRPAGTSAKPIGVALMDPPRGAGKYGGLRWLAWAALVGAAALWIWVLQYVV